MPRKPNTDERRRQIVAGLLAAMAEHGYERASIQAIGRHAGLAPGLIHYHFKNKEEILLELVRSLAGIAQARYAALAAHADAPEERLQAWLQARLDQGPGADPQAVAAWVMIGAEAVRQPQLRQAYQAAIAAELALATGLLGDCLAARGKPLAAAGTLAASLLAFMEGAFQLSSAAHGIMPEGYAAGMALQLAQRYLDGEPAAAAPDWHARWRETWSLLGPPAPADAALDELLARYREPQRHYHTLEHLAECFAGYDLLQCAMRCPGEIALALWFHDAVYEPRRGDNEALSADLATVALRAAGAREDVVARVHALIMATQGHAAPTDDPDCAILLDIDLGILGASPARFAEYERQIRAEYAHVPDEAYRIGRARVLDGFARRARIYGTARFHALYEQAARRNLG